MVMEDQKPDSVRHSDAEASAKLSMSEIFVLPPKEEMDTREKLLYAAAEVFSGKDFHSTKLEEIAERAKLAKGTIYLYFKDKTDLILSAVEFFSEKLIEIIRLNLVGINSPMMRLRILIQQWLTVSLRYHSNVRGLHSLVHILPAEHRIKLIKLRKMHKDFIYEHLSAISERVGKGTLKRSIDLLSEMILDAMVGYVSRIDAEEFRAENPPEKYARFLIDVILPHHEWLKEKV